MLCPRVHFKSVIVDGKIAYTGSANLTGNLNTGAGGLDLPQGGAAATEFGSANPAATALGQSVGASVPGSSLAPAASATTGGATTGGGGGNSILNAIKNPSLGTIGSALAGNAGSLVGLGGLTAEAIKGSQPLPQINNLQGTAQGETALGTQLQQAELTGNLPPGAQSSIDQAVKSAQAAIRSQYASMGLSGSTAETEALNNAAMQGPMLGFQIASQMASQGLSDLNLGSQLYSQIMQAQLQSDSQMQQAISNFASAAAGGGGTTVKIGGA